MTEQKQLPKVVDKSEKEILEIIQLIKDSGLPEGTKNFVVQCIELAIWVPNALQNKSISLNRLRKLLFGSGYKKGRRGKSDKDKDKDANCSETTSTEKNNVDHDVNTNSTTEDETQQTKDKSKKPGHGRMPHTVYKNCNEKQLVLDHLSVGELCPFNCGGVLRTFTPGVLIRIKGQNIADVTRYFVEKLRCDLCGYLFVADIPPEVGKEKYDTSFKAMLAIMKYYVAIPFYRQEYFQRLLDFPLPDSTQWDLIEQLANCCYPVFDMLKILAANGKLIHNDDTRLRILEIIREIKLNPDRERTGMFTTGIIAEYENHQIALFLNGTQHSGENLSDLLVHRDEDKPQIIQMCDASSSNIPKELQTIVCNCLSHGFRKFEELVDYFPEVCLTVMKKLGQVYEHDEKTKTMNGEERLIYHKTHSAPIIIELKKYIDQQIDDKLVEPNSALGKVLCYMQKHWEALTRFLSVAGAPIDNNIVERSLKIAIRNRKSAMFYKTCYSANIGGMLTSLIYTCHLAGNNPHQYLTFLQQYKVDVLEAPELWLPWNYQNRLIELNNASEINSICANHSAHPPPADHLVAA